ncbi:YdeI/OmpD-associated family protein [Mariniflexile sp.]|uniref:YdeI/OmpD-associated family protein n=1 Tax=Mariniflexile sp. TaxID=1979402 RepID=UPI0040477A58
MKKVSSVEEYIEENAHFAEALNLLRLIITKTELVENVKWNAPVYSLHGKNVLGLGAFKNHFGIWFFNGVFLKDENNLLANAQEKTKALRQMRFESIDDINKNSVLTYIKEAIENQKLGKEIKADRNKKKTAIPLELKAILAKNQSLKSSFENLSPYKQREYCDYIAEAKRDATKTSRLEKIIPMILNGIGLNDTYKDC